MKRITMISLLAVLVVLPTMAQYPRRTYGRPVPPRRVLYNSPAPYSHYRGLDWYFGLRLGGTLTTINSNDRYLGDGSPKAGLSLGVVAGVQMAPATPLYFETGMLYAEKGGKGSYGGHTFKCNLDYLEVPLVMKYQINTNRLTSIQPFAGVYAAVGVGGKIKEFDERHAYSSFDDNGFKRWDAGLRLGCGVQFENLYAELGCDVGLANVSRDYFDTAHTTSFFANIGVNF